MKDFFPKVSIIVPIKEIKKDTYKSIEYALSETHKNIEVLIIGLQEIITEIKSRYHDKCVYKVINKFEIKEALNEGINESKGEFISFLFNDVFYEKDKIEKEVIAFSQSKKETGVVFSFPFKELTQIEIEQMEKGIFSPLFLLTGNIHFSEFLFKKDVLKPINSNHKTTFMHEKLLEVLKKNSIITINNSSLITTNKSKYDETELIELWKTILEETEEKEIIENYSSLHQFYNKGIEAFDRYGFIFPKELHDIFIKNRFNPLISVIIPVYNGSNYVKEAIESVLKQTYTNYELIVVEDGSTDGGLTKKCILEYKDQLNYIHKENGGVGSALNLGIENAKGDYISWLSHDDLFYPHKLQMSVDALNEVKNPDTIIFSNFQLMDENSVPYLDTNFHKKFDIKQLENKIFPVLNGSTNGCAMVIPKVAFKKCGLFDVSQRTTNDYIMWFNIFKEFPSKFIEDHLIKYRIHKKQDSQSSPIYIPESETMWTSVFQNITKEEIEDYGYSELEFYAKFYNEMKLGGLVNTAEFLEKKYKECYEKNGPLVSVIMPCYNSKKYVRAAIDSILNQTFVAFELLCIDDSSKDSTYEILKEYENKDFRVKALKNTHKKGVSGAMNTGLEEARGEYITRMDSDDISYPERLMKEFDFLKNHPEYGICTVNIDIREDNTIVGKGSYYNDETPIEWKFLWTNPYPNAPSMFRKEIVKNVKFKEDLSVAEDYQFFMNLASHKIYYIDEVQYSYRISKNSLYHSNHLKSIYNSLEVASNYYYEITKKDYVPEIFYYLTAFSGDEIPSFEINKEQILEFLNETLDSFKKHFKWSDNEYESAKKDAMNNIYYRLIEKISRKNSYESKEYHKIINGFSWKITKPIRFSIRAVKKGRQLAKRVIKKVMK